MQLEFPSTTDDDSWDVYGEVSLEIHMPAVMSMTDLEPLYTGESLDHFINLRSITVEGTLPWDGAVGSVWEGDGGSPIPENQGAEGNPSLFDGWWVISPNYYEDAIPVLPTFYVDSAAGTWIRYDKLGTPSEPSPCRFVSDDLMVLTGPNMSDLELQMTDGVLFYTDDGHEAYVHVEDPGFPELGGYEGLWLLNNRSDTGVTYEITADRAVRTENGTVTEDKPYEVSISGIQFYQESLDADILSLNLEWPGPVLYPSADGRTLLEKATFQNYVFTREDAD